MINLGNVSTRIFIDYPFHGKKYFICKRNVKLINRFGLSDLQKLKDYFDNQSILVQRGLNDMSFDDEIKLLLSDSQEELTQINKTDITPEVYETSDSVLVGDEIVMLRQIDQNVSPYVLLYGSPFEHYGKDEWDKIGYQPKKIIFITKNIADLKDLLSHCTLKGQNAYSLYYPFIGGHASQIQKALRMYEDQIIRQIKSTGKNSEDIDIKNAFNFYRKEKEELVAEQYYEIAEYLSNRRVFVWGEHPYYHNYNPHDRAPEAKLIYDSYRKNNYDARFNRQLLIHTIANYVSIEEASDGLMNKDSKSKKKVIDRFVII